MLPPKKMLHQPAAPTTAMAREPRCLADFLLGAWRTSLGFAQTQLSGISEWEPLAGRQARMPWNVEASEVPNV